MVVTTFFPEWGQKLVEEWFLLKPTTTRMLTRIKSIYMYINENGTVTTKDLVDEFGITPRTIQRDLNVCCSLMNSCIALAAVSGQQQERK